MWSWELFCINHNKGFKNKSKFFYKKKYLPTFEFFENNIVCFATD